MPPSLEADVALLHIAGGGLRSTPPPGTVARSAPRRPGRGRADDLLFLTLTQDGKASAGRLNYLSQRAAEVFYRTSGSVTAALREAAAALNDQLADRAQASEGAAARLHLLAGVLRGADIYLAQCGRGQAVLVRQGEARHFSSQEAAERPLAGSPRPHVRYHHLEVRRGDLLLLTTAPPPVWSDPILKAVSGFEPARAVEQLSHSREGDATGLLLRLVGEGEAGVPLPDTEEAGRELAAARGQPVATRKPAAHSSALRETGRRLLAALRPAVEALRGALRRLGGGATRLLLRLAPGLVEPPPPGEFSPALLAGTAVAIPLLVLALVSVVYLRRGRSQQFQAYLLEAQAAAGAAREADEPADAREGWELANYWLQRAGEYGDSENWRLLADQVQAALDELELVFRLEFTPLVSGGFGGDSRLTHLAATASDVYILDAANTVLWHTWATGRGYEIDREFDCLDGPDSIQGMGTPIDTAIQAPPGALGAEGVVAIDADGTLLYCAPERRARTGRITPPDTGFGQIRAIDVFGDTLYVLDPRANAVWLYDATGGLFSGEAGIYFVETVPDLSDAVDIAKSQEELFILHSDGTLDRCRRTRETEGGGAQIRVECEQDLRFKDDRPGGQEADSIPDAEITEMIYSAPPEPSLYFLDETAGAVYHYSMRMAYQGQIRPLEPFPETVTTLTLGPPNDLFIATDHQVYYAPLR